MCASFGVAYRDHVSCEDTGCPFDLQHVTLKPGKRNFPLHTHGSMWELYYALAGSATMRTDEETVALETGDSYLCRVGLAHQIINDSGEDFVYLVIANDPPHDTCYYPDSGKLPKALGANARSLEILASPGKRRVLHWPGVTKAPDAKLSLRSSPLDRDPRSAGAPASRLTRPVPPALHWHRQRI